MIYKVKKKKAGSQVGISHLVAISSDDDDEKKVNAREQQWIDNEPDLAEYRIEVLLMELRPGVLGDERSSFPEHAPIALEGWQTRFKWLVDLYGGGFVHCERLPYGWALTLLARARAEKSGIPRPRTYALSAKSTEV